MQINISDGINLLQCVNVLLCLFIICNGYELSVLMVCDAKSVRSKLIPNGRMFPVRLLWWLMLFFVAQIIYFYSILFLFQLNIRYDTIFLFWNATKRCEYIKSNYIHFFLFKCRQKCTFI